MRNDARGKERSMSEPIYADEPTYSALVISVACELPPSPWTGSLDLNRARIELGERGNIWPIGIRADAEISRA